MATPSEELTQRVMEALVKERVLAAKEAEKLAARIAGGKIKPEDWLVGIENSLHAQTEAQNG